MVLVKICGITNADDAHAAVEAGADALGFNFWRPGKRYVTPEAAARITEQLPERIMKVGVFVDEEAGEVARIVQELRLSVVQFHGSETPECVAGFAAPTEPRLKQAAGFVAPAEPRLKSAAADEKERFPAALGRLQLWKAFRVGASFQPRDLAAYSVDAFLLDGAGPAPGGNAATFDWPRAREARQFGHVILAGGLNPANVAEAIRAVDPWGVDVASGVESAPGKKDATLVRRFVTAAREASG